MLRRILIITMLILAIVHGLLPDLIGSGIVPLFLVLSGLLYGSVATDAENPTAFLVVVLAAGATSEAGVLSNIHVVGGSLDAILAALMHALYSCTITIIVLRAYNRLR